MYAPNQHINILVIFSSVFNSVLEQFSTQSFFLSNHVKNKKYRNFISISSLTGKCAAQKNKNKCFNVKICKCLVSNLTQMSSLINVHIYLKLWAAVARHNFNWVMKIYIYLNVALKCLSTLDLN